jgi:hypothetical protein
MFDEVPVREWSRINYRELTVWVKGGQRSDHCRDLDRLVPRRNTPDTLAFRDDGAPIKLLGTNRS